MDVCGMLVRPWHDDTECKQPAVGTHERTVRVCAECALVMRKEGFEVVYDGVVAHHFMRTAARVGECFRFEHPDEPQFNCDLTVVSVTGDGPEDLVFFNDHTHCKQRHLDNAQRLP